MRTVVIAIVTILSACYLRTMIIFESVAHILKHAIQDGICLPFKRTLLLNSSQIISHVIKCSTQSLGCLIQWSSPVQSASMWLYTCTLPTCGGYKHFIPVPDTYSRTWFHVCDEQRITAVLIDPVFNVKRTKTAISIKSIVILSQHNTLSDIIFCHL